MNYEAAWMQSQAASVARTQPTSELRERFASERPGRAALPNRSTVPILDGVEAAIERFYEDVVQGLVAPKRDSSASFEV
mgnify:CR=1 FL=1